MATYEDIDEAEELRFLALKSMVKRSKPNNPNVKSKEPDESDDQDILLLRAAALKTISQKTPQNGLFPNKNDELENGQVKKIKRSKSGQVPTMDKNKHLKLNGESEISDSVVKTNPRVSSEVSKHDVGQKRRHYFEPDTKSQGESITSNKDDVKKTIRNGSIQLSNLDSKIFDETLVVRVTFSSSESDENSSNECDTIEKNVQKNTLCNNVNSIVVKSQVPIKNIVENHYKTADPKSLEDNRIKMNNCMQKMCGLMKNCESEIENRNQQIKILLEAYEKYKNYSRSVYSILQSMKSVRDELSVYNSLETKTADD